MGMLIWEPAPNSSLRKPAMASGMSLPNPTPIAMQSATQTVRYLSKKLIFFAVINISLPGHFVFRNLRQGILQVLHEFRLVPAETLVEFPQECRCSATGRRSRCEC